MDSQQKTMSTSNVFSSKNNDNPLSVFSFEELQKLTHEKNEEKKIKFSDRIKIGRDDAINHITQGSYDKMKLSASKGYDTTIIYFFSWVSDPEAKVDNNGNKTVFEGNVRLSDLINKDRVNFIEDLNKYFNNDGENNFHCYVKKNNFKGETVWTINVSWGKKNENLYQNKYTHSKKYGNKHCNEHRNGHSDVYDNGHVHGHDHGHVHGHVHGHDHYHIDGNDCWNEKKRKSKSMSI